MELTLATPAKSGLHVLVVEDNPVNQKVAEGLLRKIGCEVDLAPNGAEAVEAIQVIAYDMIFMDLQMPVMGGLEATRTIRQIEERNGQHTPIVAITANVLESDRIACLEAGMDDYLRKPVRPAELSEAIVRWCGGNAFPHAA